MRILASNPGEASPCRVYIGAFDRGGGMSVHCQADDERFSFEAFTRHPFFTEVNRWIVERVIGPGRRKIVDLGCGPGAVTKLILERLGGDPRNVEVIGIDPSPSALSKARENELGDRAGSAPEIGRAHV